MGDANSGMEFVIEAKFQYKDGTSENKVFYSWVEYCAYQSENSARISECRGVRKELNGNA